MVCSDLADFVENPHKKRTCLDCDKRTQRKVRNPSFDFYFSSLPLFPPPINSHVSQESSTSGTSKHSSLCAPESPNWLSSPTTLLPCERVKSSTTPCWGRPLCITLQETMLIWEQLAVSSTESLPWVCWMQEILISSAPLVRVLLKCITSVFF